MVPPADATYRYQLQTQGNRVSAQGHRGRPERAAGWPAARRSEALFVGPKLQSQLDGVRPALSLVTDYGKLRVDRRRHCSGCSTTCIALVGNWGFAIIIVTLLLKLLFYPLAEASGRSMAKMKALAPRLTQLRETYKDDREKLNRAMMELYQREKVNPLAGCLPMVIQIPVFLAFYWVLRDSVEIRQAPFIFWINDLSSRDPFFVLPAIMAAAMFVQYELNPQVGDPTQQKVFMFMPLAMSVTFAFFPAGLVLYWVTNTLLSILQQWNINRRIEATPSAAPASGEPTRSSRPPRRRGAAASRSCASRVRRCPAIAWARAGRTAARARRDHGPVSRRRRQRDRSAGSRCIFPRRTPIPASTCSSCMATAVRWWCEALIARALELGARRARPGEFTQRAYLNGKLDLAQAEAVADLIDAASEAAARAALRSLEGEFSRRVHALCARRSASCARRSRPRSISPMRRSTCCPSAEALGSRLAGADHGSCTSCRRPAARGGC